MYMCIFYFRYAILSPIKKKKKGKKIVKSNPHADVRLRVDRLYLTFPNPILLEHGNERRGGNPASWSVSRVFELNNDRL